MSDKDYNVGYGKPPANHQFQPGTSGNPKGRPKGIKNLSTDLEEELNQKVSVTEAGQQTQTTKQRAMIKTLFAKAMSGDVRASDVLIKLILGLEASRINSNQVEVLEDEDIAILEAFKMKILEEEKNPNGEENHD